MRKLNFIKGILVGIAKIIPGFSGAVLMISFNLYDRAIRAITNFFDDVINNFLFLLEFGLGVLVGIVFFSKIVVFLLTHYYLYTMAFFVGLILGGVPCIMKHFSFSVRNILLIILSFGFVMLLSFLDIQSNYTLHHNFFDIIMFFFSGILEAVGMVIPGISSTALLMLIGIYSYYIEIVSHLFSIHLFFNNLFFLIPFSLGIVVGVIFISLLVNYFFRYHEEEMFSVIFGFSLGSLFLLVMRFFPLFVGGLSVVICFLFIAFGFLVTNKL